VLLVCFACSSGSHAQSISQKYPAITFHFSGDTNTKVLSSGKSDKPLSAPLCECTLQATLTQISRCGTPLTHPIGKGEVPLDNSSCCCAELKVSFTCPGTSLCGFDIVFDNDNFDPLCQVCFAPPGWTVTPNPNGSLSIDFSGSDCSGSLVSGAPPLDFQFCGFNTPGPVGYTVTGWICQQGGVAGSPCMRGTTEFCSKHFESTINCGTGPDAVTTTYIPFSVDGGYPNPATSSIRFDYSTPATGILSCTLFDVLGKTVSTSSNNVSVGSGNVTINLNGAQPGAYYCVFELSGQRVTKRIVVK
jgi:Secretion system C-terminal sorting domain